MERKTGKFWKDVPFERMDSSQWESLCDGCGRCCLRKIFFEDTLELVYTRVACRYLDSIACTCTSYQKRSTVNPECLVLTPENLPSTVPLLPDTCAYRRIAEGKDLPSWHPLVSHDPQTVHRSFISVRGRVVCEDDIAQEDLEDHIIDWIDAGS